MNKARGNSTVRVRKARWIKPPRVDWEPLDACWYIYIYDGDAGDGGSGLLWWPIRWMRFATRDLALAHLEMHGAP